MPRLFPIIFPPLLFFTATALGDLPEVEKLFQTGRYEECLDQVEKEIDNGAWREDWRIWKLQCELTLGRYQEALATLDEALKRHKTSVEVRWVGRKACLHNNDVDRAGKLLEEIESLARTAPWRYSDAAGRVTLGRYFLHQGADARQVLELFFDRARRDRPSWSGPLLASGELALSKNDFAVAADSFREAQKLDPNNPEVHCGLARALSDGDGDAAKKAIEKALSLNPRHIDSLLFLADNHIDAERYDKAEGALKLALDVNERHPLAWAYRAVIAHLKSDGKAEARARQTALSTWQTNPHVDHLIGRKLSQKYRFAEGADSQRRALKFDPDFLPAKAQLCSDLLRLGEEDEGWRLAEEVNEKDQYNVSAHNLVALQDLLAKFKTLQQDGFILRMDSQESEIYGELALNLLSRAKASLCDKYQVQLDQPVIVEIFPKQEDFAIRTFGLPGGAGFLGVCFGRVITANSPASQGDSPSNWQSVLWHEFCHVVTLTKTSNKMPRWLSEGISVYEERLANPAWGQWMSPQYRKMILEEDELVPVGQLSGAFLNPSSPLHLQFAYYQSALVVEHLVDRYGIDALRRILTDLGVGMPINEALARHTGSLKALEQDFEAFAKRRARSLAPAVDWATPSDEELSADNLTKWTEEHPASFPALQVLARRQIEQEDWQSAKETLQALGELYPNYVGPHNAYAMLAEVHRQLGETELERAALQVLTALDDDALTACVRLAELCRLDEDWQGMYQASQAAVAVQPMMPAPHRSLAEAAEKLERLDVAINSRRALLSMSPADPAQAHFDLARLLAETNDADGAKRQTLKSLEEAPRFRDAQQLLLKFIEP